MKELLADIKARLLNGEYKIEEHVRRSLVARVLQGLGWNIWNPIEVNTEFVVVPNEDSKKVDVALFLRPFVPTVFVEIKAVGQMQGKLPATELQMRNYNRDNQAMFTVTHQLYPAVSPLWDISDGNPLFHVRLPVFPLRLPLFPLGKGDFQG